MSNKKIQIRIGTKRGWRLGKDTPETFLHRFKRSLILFLISVIIAVILICIQTR